MLPAGLSAPFTSLLADRRSRRDLLLEASVVQAAALALVVAAVALDAPLAVVLALRRGAVDRVLGRQPDAGVAAAAAGAQPEQLAAANVVTYGIESAGYCVGSLLGGVLVAAAGRRRRLRRDRLAFALSAALRGLPRDAPPPHREARAGERLSREVLAGFAAVLAEPRLRLVVGVLSVATLVEGAVDVLIVVVALDVLDAGEAGLGWLNAAWAVGGISAARPRSRCWAAAGSPSGSGAAACSRARRSPASRRGRRSRPRSRCWSCSASATR